MEIHERIGNKVHEEKMVSLVVIYRVIECLEG